MTDRTARAELEKLGEELVSRRGITIGSAIRTGRLTLALYADLVCLTDRSTITSASTAVFGIFRGIHAKLTTTRLSLMAVPEIVFIGIAADEECDI